MDQRAEASAGAVPFGHVDPLMLWRCSNQRRSGHESVLRLAFATLTVAYVVVLITRMHRNDPLDLLLVRLALVLYTAAGTAFVSRFSWAGLRAYTVILSLAFPLGAAWCHARTGNSMATVPITGLAIATPMMLLQTGRDYVFVTIGQFVCQGLLLAVLPPPPDLPLVTVAVILGVSAATGGVAGMAILSYRVSLQISLSSLERAMRAKSEFLNTMSHELRSPLNVIVGYADILREHADPEVGQLTGRIRSSAVELLHLVENTMQVARLGAGKLPLHVQEFAPADLVAELAENVRALPEAKHAVPVHWEVTPNVPHARLDRLKVKEIIQNLVSNALKFTREGSVRVTVSVDAGQLHVAVRDSGPGIPPASQDRIFEMFERVEDPGVPRAPGVGLGLYIVKSLTELMGGQIELASQPGHGTCFTVKLPLELAGA